MKISIWCIALFSSYRRIFIFQHRLIKDRLTIIYRMCFIIIIAILHTGWRRISKPIFLVYYYHSRWSYIKHTCTTYARYYFKWQTDYIFSFTHKRSFSSWCWMLPLLVISSAIKHKNHIHWHWEVLYLSNHL